ncbi:LysM peptidoglycan-binding domain-containing protein [Bacillus salitolerans]|uniref:LysM peptidoglycan-binding domain-containing protein n=1 Tax=Bacillus salitolerans TaxID=1437434 RepID=A0ABW4LMP3_9BACI
MSFRLSKQNILLLMTIIIIALAGFVNAYLFIMKPVQANVETLQGQLQQEEAMLSTVEASVNNRQEKAYQGTTELQKKLPVDPLLEQFILDLEKAEIVSGSFISTMSFGEKVEDDGGTSLVDEYLKEAEKAKEENADLTDIGSNDDNEDGEKTSPETSTDLPMPEGVQKLSVNLTVESPTYFELEAFIAALENLPRITKIDSLTFAGIKEIVTTENKPEKLTYTLTVSTFYFPKLEELKSQLPPLEVPSPSQKVNPLVPVVPKDETEGSGEDSPVDEGKGTSAQNENEYTEKTKSETNQATEPTSQIENYTLIRHVVQPGETLFRISLKYYKDRSGEQIIKEWNNLTGDQVNAGQVLNIPIKDDDE